MNVPRTRAKGQHLHQDLECGWDVAKLHFPPGSLSPPGRAQCPPPPPGVLLETGSPLMVNTLSGKMRGWMCFQLRKLNKNSLSILLKTQF